ncbi:MAG: MraY family glycosyltransferase [Planctomycetota bacterium]
MEPWLVAPITLLALLLAVLCHRRLCAIFPEDQPGQAARKQHPEATPLVGWTLGLAALALSLGQWWLMAAIALTTYIGYLDDRAKDGNGAPGVTWHHKGRFIAAATACGTVHLWQVHADMSPIDIALVSVILLVIINAVNFLDNANGVSAALGSMGLLLATGADGPLAMVGFVYLGFLPLNWPRARIFLGDSGTLTLGLCLGVAALDAGLVTQPGVTLSSLLPMAVFLVDFAQVLIARLVLGVPPWVGDRRHITHILMNLHLPRWLLAPLLAGGGWLAFDLAPHLQ